MIEERIKKLKELSLDPFKPDALLSELEELLSLIPQLSKEEGLKLYEFLQELKPRLEENHLICFGWVEETFKKKGLNLRA